ncbi:MULTISPECIES: MBL fold metallo-hydrolase [unclassified Rhizobium]|uniref:MBL fold metallo-hydrolase n=1 Tax=unclassified Rhizobium TaxID=2613769 RepID=UPI0007EB1C22|nr:MULTISPECIES: MBL fold metallo-hydrolase [unclassified Rhizobium]ANM14708.1 metallo-beta-lactamase family hydrolase protein [Rhizobium sp. N324]ANM21097.1 metallo-beta-lactamase family hydrolase protein [Rhizobium sp. N541]ANM27468.1 metallo-beta-lactamase family hydrolase protein [Rhizobium sp. N941]OYC99811.1 metallo-beta-lactamase family hydrolase protein [Rhizobium sp. N4311]
MNAPVELCSYPELDDRIVIVRAGEEVDAVFVLTERFNVLIDTLGTPEQCLRALDLLEEKAAARPLIVINSHMDWDHFWGNAAIAGRAPIIAHTAALDRLRDPSAQQLLKDKMNQESRFQNVELIGPDITFSGAMVLNGGDLTLELIHTPGHTPDHIAVWIPELRTCLAVDAVEYPIPEVWSRTAGDLRLIRSSLQRIRDLDARLIIPAHGQTSSPSTVKANLAYFEALADRVDGLSERQLADGRLTRSSGFRLEDFVAIPDGMPADTATFYRNCHETNLGATVQAHIEKRKSA